MAATDPVEEVKQRDYQTGLTLDLVDALKRLAALPPSVAAPYVTLTLSWEPEGSNPNKRPGHQYFLGYRDQFLDQFEPHSPAYESVSPDLDRINAYLDSGVPPEAHGLVVVANSDQGVFETLPLGLPVPNRLATGPTPLLFDLAKMMDEHSPYAVLLADQHQAVLTLVSEATPEHAVEVEGTEYPVHQKQGGWSQRRYQDRADQRIAHFARTVGDETRRELDATGIGMLVVAASEPVLTALNDGFVPEVKERIIGTIRLQMEANPQQIVEAAQPVVEQTEREQEARAVQNVHDQTGSGAAGVAGAEDTLTALQSGQVMQLVMNDDYQAPGWADFTYPLYGVGKLPKQHPAGGDVANIVPIALAEEMVRLAIQEGADIEVVRTAVPAGEQALEAIHEHPGAIPRTQAALKLDALGGVGAVLRYALAENQSTANL